MLEYIGLAFALGIVNPIMEEVFWRGYVKKVVKNSWYTMVFIELHFAAYHWFTMTYLFNPLIGTVTFFGVFLFGIM